jgi:hypothetical protein
LGLALPALALFFTGCLTQTTYETANLLKKNHVDITPNYSGYYLHASGPDAPDVNSNWKNSYADIGFEDRGGFTGALVVNNVFNVALPQRLYLRPQIGMDVSALLYSVPARFLLASINVGIGLGREF